jgi:hypothetical protein
MILKIPSAVFLLLLSCPASTLSQAVNNRTNTTQHVDSAKHEVHPEMAINVVTDCGAVGDGVTDDWAAIQACLTDHPGKTIFFPKMRAVPCLRGAGGGCQGSVDYYVSKTLKLSGNGQALIGTSPSRWPGGAVQIKFSPTITGPGIWVPVSVYSGYVANLFLNGQRCWNSTDLRTFDQPKSITGVGPDGILLTGGEPSVDGVTAYCFGRHGFAVLGDNQEGEATPGQPDFWSIRNSFAYANRGYGLYITGADSNAGESIALKTTGNQLGGIFDHSQLGNTHISPASHVDNRNPVPAGAGQPIASISVSNGICSLTTKGPLIGGSDRENTWITIDGTPGGAFDGTFRVSAVNSVAHALRYACSSSGGSAVEGNVHKASSTEVYLAYNAAGIKTGAYLGRGESSISVWINPYCELNSNAPDFSPTSIVIGRDCEGNVRGDRTWTSWIPGPGWGSTMRSGQGLALDNSSDTMNWLTIRAGRTKEQYKGIRFSGVGQKAYWDLGQYNDSYFFIRDAQSKGFYTITLNRGGSTEISAPNNAAVRLGRGSNGGVQFFGGTIEVANIDSAGKGTFSGVCLSAGICWNSGKDAPAAGSCTRGKGGSLYTRTDGGPATTLYVCDGSTGAWMAK